MSTRSEAYFLDLFKSATLNGAIERAAESEREQLQGSVAIPIDVFRLAAHKGIRVSKDLVGSSCEDGLLIPFSGGYKIRLKRGSTESRRRFSLAHELGHSLFYKDSGNGPRHQIGVLSNAERVAEERICNLFASALLMPPLELRESLMGLSSDSPSQILDRLEASARRFRVSLLALLQRLRHLEVAGPGCLLVYLSRRSNPSTGEDTTLRVDGCVNLGRSGPSHIWRNRSAEGVGLKGAKILYEKWREKHPELLTKGSFGLDPDSGLPTAELKHADVHETVILAHATAGKWLNEATRVVSSSRLYVWDADKEEAAYVVSALRLTSTPLNASRAPELDSQYGAKRRTPGP